MSRVLKATRALTTAAAALLTVSAYAADPTILPRLDATPGSVILSCTIRDICPHERAGLRGSVSASMRADILRSYGATKYCSQSGACELDHLISVELCGATVRGNLWPQSYLYGEGARMKDLLENEMHRRVCAGDITLKDAQKAISTDWLAAYVKYAR